MSDRIEKFFEANNDEYLKFEDVKTKLSQRPDLHAFILLDHLCPGDSDLICAAAHDEYWLSTDLEELDKVVTDAQLLDLIRCGVRYDDGHFAFFA